MNEENKAVKLASQLPPPFATDFCIIVAKSVLSINIKFTNHVVEFLLIRNNSLYEKIF
ncbi:MAG: hypothetical protein HQK65_13245 [Desulfamplus sp.]|nr:hypothetical protein [Desulfamplus sp.]